MSLDISVTNPKTGESLEMNWLRNPFGLCSWAEQNYTYAMEREPEEEQSLWYVINHWNYDKADQVDRPLFLDVVQRYGKVIQQLREGYFWLSEGNFNQFIVPHLGSLPFEAFHPYDTFALYGAKAVPRYHFGGKEHLGLLMEYLGNPCFDLSDRYYPDHHTLTYYQGWFQHLVALAEMLQDPETIFYCSN